MGVAWKESTPEGLRPPQYSEGSGAPASPHRPLDVDRDPFTPLRSEKSSSTETIFFNREECPFMMDELFPIHGTTAKHMVSSQKPITAAKDCSTDKARSNLK